MQSTGHDKLDWHKYIQAFQSYFFELNLYQYINLIKKDIQNWKELTLKEHMQFSKHNNGLHRLPNLGISTTDNFGTLVSKVFVSASSHWAFIDKLDHYQSVTYQHALDVH